MRRRSAYMRERVSIKDIVRPGSRLCRRLLAMCWSDTPSDSLQRLRCEAMSYDVTEGEDKTVAEVMMDIAHRDIRREFGEFAPFMSVSLTLTENIDGRAEAQCHGIIVRNQSGNCRIKADSVTDAILFMRLIAENDTTMVEKGMRLYEDSAPSSRTALLRRMVRSSRENRTV